MCECGKKHTGRSVNSILVLTKTGVVYMDITAIHITNVGYQDSLPYEDFIESVKNVKPDPETGSNIGHGLVDVFFTVRGDLVINNMKDSVMGVFITAIDFAYSRDSYIEIPSPNLHLFTDIIDIIPINGIISNLVEELEYSVLDDVIPLIKMGCDEDAIYAAADLILDEDVSVVQNIKDPSVTAEIVNNAGSAIVALVDSGLNLDEIVQMDIREIYEMRDTLREFVESKQPQ